MMDSIIHKVNGFSFEQGAQQDIATSGTCTKNAIGHAKTLFSLVYQEGDSARWGKRSVLGWDEDVASVKSNGDVTLIQALPVAATVSQLSLPADCQKDLVKYLKSLSRDPRKKSDVRDMRQMALADPAAAEDLQVVAYPDCGIVQFGIVFKFCCGLCQDWFSSVDSMCVTESLYEILDRLEELNFKLQRDSITIKFGIVTGDDWMKSSQCKWSIVVRTETGAQAHTLKSKLEGMDLCSALRGAIPIRQVLGESDDIVAYRGVGSTFWGSGTAATFDFEMKESVRVIGGKILDIIDPCRASIDPVEALPEDMPPRWISALVVERRDHEEDAETNLQFASEISGIPWMGPRTLTNPLYCRLAQVLKAMQALFARISRPLMDEDGSCKVHVKAQAYVLRTGDEIIGQLHQEGVRADRIESVGLFYPEVDQMLVGGDLEITVVMTGGCGSKYPVSMSIPVTSGTAVVFDNLTVYHRMTSLKCTQQDAEGHRLVLGFFVLRKDDPEMIPPGSEVSTVNYADKAGAMVRLACARKKLPLNVRNNIVTNLAGDFEHMQRVFHFSRAARSKSVTHAGLTLQACD